jgi:hypothetical protein
MNLHGFDQTDHKAGLCYIPVIQACPAMAEALAGADVLPPPPPPSQYWLPRHIKKRRRPSSTPYRTVAVGAVPPSRGSLQGCRSSAPSQLNISTPAAVAIGPYHHLLAMEAIKRAAVVEFCWAVGQSSEQVCKTILALAKTARSCLRPVDEKLISIDDGELAKMLFVDGCFLVQFMVSSMCPKSHEQPHPRADVEGRGEQEQDPLMSRADVHARISTPSPGMFLDRMASAFDISSSTDTKPSPNPFVPVLPPVQHHLLGLFHRRQVGKVRTQKPSHRHTPIPG